MSTFEERFPNLEDKKYYPLASTPIGLTPGINAFFFTLDDVDKFCLDKEKYLEMLNNYKKDLDNIRSQNEQVIKDYDELMLQVSKFKESHIKLLNELGTIEEYKQKVREIIIRLNKKSKNIDSNTSQVQIGVTDLWMELKL
jgi:uncharacterized phage infection (PIP) family protein YhgE